MSLTWHMVASDLHRLRWLLLLWIVVLAATPLLGLTLLWGDGRSAQAFVSVVDAGKLAAVLEVVAGLALVPLLLHSDPVVGSTSFWMTRPITRARLWWAKVAGLGFVFGILPVAVMLPWWLVCGYGPREVTLASGETLLWQTAIVMLALPVAALTREFSRFFLWQLVVVTAIWPASIFLLFVPQLGTQTAQDLVYVWTRAWFALAIFLAGGTIAAAWQFRARRAVQSFGVFGLTGIVALAVLGYWPRRFTPAPPPGVEEKAGPIAGRIRVDFEKAQVDRLTQQGADVSVSLKFTGIPEDVLVSPAWDLAHEAWQPAEHLWTWGSGLRLMRQGWIQTGGQRFKAEEIALGLPLPSEYPSDWLERANERRRQSGMPPITPREGRFGDARVQVPQSFATRTRLESPAYRLRLRLDLTRPKLVAEGPLREGASLRVGRTSIRVAHLDFDRRNPARASRLIECSPMLLWDGGAWTLVPMLRSFWRSEPRAFLVNRARGNSLSSLGGKTWGRFGSVRITRRELPQHAPWELRESKWGGAENWYDGATLAVLTHEWEERFVKEVRVEQFELAPPPNAGGGR